VTEPLGYLDALRRFSRNAKLYLAHIVGMDVIHGTWEVIFNLYLLEVGFSIQFIGLRLVVMGVARVIAAVPAGWLSDRVGRKWGFIIGDGGGAVMALVQIMSVVPVVLLVAPAIRAAFSALHHVTESPFMAENSEPEERIHLFSVGSGMRTLAAMTGALVAGFAPGWLAEMLDVSRTSAFRWATMLGIVGWFLSLIPAVMLRPYTSREVAEAMREAPPRPGLFGGVRSPGTIRRFLVVTGLIALGGGFTLRLANVFFQEGVSASEGVIGVTFAAGSLFLATAAFMAPLVEARLGKVRSVVLSRLAAIPFIVVIGLAPGLATPTAVISLAGTAFVLRTMLFNMSGPIYEAFSMELLHPGERATFTGLETLLAGGLAAVGGWFGASLMNDGDFGAPWLIMAVLYLASVAAFWVYFRDHDRPEARLAGARVAG
jgi:MFS family permease